MPTQNQGLGAVKEQTVNVIFLNFYDFKIREKLNKSSNQIVYFFVPCMKAIEIDLALNFPSFYVSSVFLQIVISRCVNHRFGVVARVGKLSPA